VNKRVAIGVCIVVLLNLVFMPLGGFITVNDTSKIQVEKELIAFDSNYIEIS